MPLPDLRQGLFLYWVYHYICARKTREMRNILLALATVIAVFACNRKPDGYTINGTMKGDVDNGTLVFLKKTGENNQPVDVDTTTVENGKFLFKGTAGTPELHYIFIDKLMGYVGVVVENGDIEVNAQKDSLAMASIKGTPQNDIFADYIEKSQSITKRAMSIQKDMEKATLGQNEASLTALREEMNELKVEYETFEANYIKNNPNGLISAMLIERALATGTVPVDEVKKLYELLTPEIKQTKAAKNIQDRIKEVEGRMEKQKSTNIGAKAPNFSAPDPTGKELALNDVMGKVTLIDFWAAWCRPCRAENPNVLSVYKKYHVKGLNIIGVSLDKKEEDWKKAIIDDGLEWSQVSNLAYFDDAIAKLYNVDAIPAAFLLDENGVIVAKNLRGPDLEAKVAELLQ